MSASQETTPLILNSTQNVTGPAFPENGPSNGDQESDPPGLKTIVSISSQVFYDSVPVILSYVIQNSIQTSAVLVAGRLGPEELSVSAFALMLAFVSGASFNPYFSYLDPTRIYCSLLYPIGWCVALGGTTALDTLGSQAFTGENPRQLALHFQRSVFLLCILFAPVAVLWWNISDVLMVLGQSENLSRDVQSFLRVLVTGAPGYIGFESLKKYLQCQGIMKSSTAVLAAVFPINLLCTILLVHCTSFGIIGAAIALSLAYWLCFALLGICTFLSPTHTANRVWDGIHVKTLLDPHGCFQFLKLAIPGIIMVGTEWAAFEIVALAAGKLGSLPLAAQSVIMTTDQILNTIPFGIGVAASTRVGNLIGAQDADGARMTAHAAALVSAVTGGLVMVCLVLLKDVFGYIFSDNTRVIELVSHVMPLVASFQVADGLAGSCGGALRAQGRQHLGAIFNIVAYYVLALPIGITLAFSRGMGLEGLWIGQVAALFIVGLGEYAVVWRGTDWSEEVNKGLRRSRDGSA